MLMKKRTFTAEEKVKIIQEAKENGVTATCEKYGLYAASFYSWKKKLDQMGIEGLLSPCTNFDPPICIKSDPPFLTKLIQ